MVFQGLWKAVNARVQFIPLPILLTDATLAFCWSCERLTPQALIQRLLQVWQVLFSWISFCGADSRGRFTRMLKLLMPQPWGTTDAIDTLCHTCHANSNCNALALNTEWTWNFFLFSLFNGLTRSVRAGVCVDHLKRCKTSTIGDSWCLTTWTYRWFLVSHHLNLSVIPGVSPYEPTGDSWCLTTRTYRWFLVSHHMNLWRFLVSRLYCRGAVNLMPSTAQRRRWCEIV